MRIEPSTPGFYGKIPENGDFISRRLPAQFTQTWDAWLQHALTASKKQLGDRWLDIYLASPIWRFSLSTGICGPSAWAGILIPSMDSVGRYFPLTLAASIREQEVLPDLFFNSKRWFDSLEQLALSVLHNEINVSEFDQKLQDLILNLPIAGSLIQKTKADQRLQNCQFEFQIEMENLDQMPDALNQLNARLLSKFLSVFSLWSTAGSERSKPCLRVYENLPPQRLYTELLLGPDPPKTPSIDNAVPDSSANTEWQTPDGNFPNIGSASNPSIQWHSCARSTVGKQRKVNEDACLQRPEIGLWVVADGMGGHRAGDTASKAVIDAFSTLAGTGNLETFSNNVTESLRRVNSDLLAMAGKLGAGQIIGTTVVVLLAVDEKCAVIWAGDSRLYQYRDGDLSQLTSDHSLAADLSRKGTYSGNVTDAVTVDHIITRALGAEPELLVDIVSFEAKVGDAYLLCSDGLVKEVSQQDILDILSHNNCQESSQKLIDLALARGARDNVTVIVVQADPHEPAEA